MSATVLPPPPRGDTAVPADDAVDTAGDPQGPGPRPRRRGRDLAGWTVFTAGALTAAVWLTELGRGMTFFYDEWSFIDTRGQSFWHDVWLPHQGHPSMIPFTAYRLLLLTVGLRHYWPYLALVLAVNLVCGWLVFLLLRRRVHPAIAGALASVLMLLGPGFQDLLWPFQIGFLGSVAGGLAALVLLDRRTHRADLGACAVLLVAVGCSGICVPFLVGISIELCWRRRWRHLWVTIVPAVAFGLWFLWQDRGEHTSSPGIGTALHFYGQAATATMAAGLGRDMSVGTVGAVVLGFLALAGLARRPSQAGRLVMALAGAGTFWTMTLVARGISLPLPSRYIYPSLVFALLVVGELPGLLAGPDRGDVRAGASRPRHAAAGPDGATLWRRGAGIAVAVGVAAVVAFSALVIYWNSTAMTEGARGLVGNSATVRATLAGVELAGSADPPTYRPDITGAPQIEVGQYLAAARAYGSPADPVDRLRTLPDFQRAFLDESLLGGLGMTFSATTLPTSAVPCGTLGDAGPGGALAVRQPAGGLVVQAAPGLPLEVFARSYGPAYWPVGDVAAGTTVRIRWKGAHRVPVSWLLELVGHGAGTSHAAGAALCAH
jgi:hypothetical protein